MEDLADFQQASAMTADGVASMFAGGEVT